MFCTLEKKLLLFYFVKQITEPVFAPLNALKHPVEWGIYFPKLSSSVACCLRSVETSHAR